MRKPIPKNRHKSFEILPLLRKSVTLHLGEYPLYMDRSITRVLVIAINANLFTRIFPSHYYGASCILIASPDRRNFFTPFLLIVDVHLNHSTILGLILIFITTLRVSILIFSTIIITNKNKRERKQAWTVNKNQKSSIENSLNKGKFLHNERTLVNKIQAKIIYARHSKRVIITIAISLSPLGVTEEKVKRTRKRII